MIEIINAPVAQEYERWMKKIADDPYKSCCVIGIHDVLRAHFLLVDFFFKEQEGLGGVGPRDLNLLHSAINRQLVSYGGKAKWSDKYDLCATLFWGLIKNHPFHDCNKRTALLSALYFLLRIGRTPDAPQKDFENLTVRVAESKLNDYKEFKRFEKVEDAEVRFLSNFFKRNTREIDKRSYIVTYNQLNQILSRYKHRLEYPADNYIDIVKDEVRVRGLIRRTREMVTVSVMRIRFPGWRSEVNASTVRAVRKKLNLEDRDGVDSRAFFHGVDPLEALISTYKGPLQRLANR